MTTKLAAKTCGPEHASATPLLGAAMQELLAQLDGDWRVEDNHHLVRTWEFDDFKDALSFTNEVGAEAEAQDHHPDIRLAYGEAEVTIWTHKINGLTENDFILAARIDARTGP
ncbi:MAG: 4a-hydroxytetrahydrobiopterin dehydratase [Candidatus Krumholzibacteriia bacterium]